MPTPNTGTGPGFTTPLPPGGTTTQAGPSYASILQTYQQQLQAAQSAYDQATQTRDDALQRLQTVQADSKLAAQFGDSASTAYNAALSNWRQAADQLQNAYKNQADGKLGIAKVVGTPEEQQKLQFEAQAAQFNATKVKSDVEESTETRPERINQIRANSNNAIAQADVAMAKARLATATEGSEKALAETAVQQANTALERTKAALTTDQANAGVAPAVAKATAAGATADATVKEAQAAVASATTKQEIAAANEKLAQAIAATTTAQAGATVATAQASVAPDKAQADLRNAQATADQAELTVRQTRANLDATTDEDRRQAIQQKLKTDQAALDQATFNLDLARRTADSAVAQAGANVKATQAGTQNTLEGIQRAQQGTLYGVQQRIQQISNLIASGQIDPAQGNDLLQQHITTAIQGTTPFELGKFQTETATTRRGQDTQLAASKMADYTSFANNAFTQMVAMNRSAPPGSDKMAYALNDMLQQGRSAFNEMGAIPQAPDSPLLAAMRARPQGGMPQQAMPQMPAPPPAPAATPITINVGTPQQQPQYQDYGQVQAAMAAQQGHQPPSGMDTSASPLGSGQLGQGNLDFGGGQQSPEILKMMQPATPNHVAGMWDPDVFGEAMRRMQAGAMGGG